MQYIIETDRLFLREIEFEDAAFMLQLLNSPGWLKYIGDRKIKSVEDADAYILNGPRASYSSDGFGLYLVQLKENNVSIGVCGLLKREYLEFVDLGFAFLSDYEGKGYAYEAAHACLNYSRTHLAIQSFSAITVDYNTRSINLLIRLGFKYERDFLFESTNEMLQVYLLV